MAAFNNADPAYWAPYGQGYVGGSARAPSSSVQDQARILSVAQWNAKTWMTTILEKYDVDVVVTGMLYAGHAGAYGVPALTIPAGRDFLRSAAGCGSLVAITCLSRTCLPWAMPLSRRSRAALEPDLNAALQMIEAVTGK